MQKKNQSKKKIQDKEFQVTFKQVVRRISRGNIWKLSIKDSIFTLAVFAAITIAAFFFKNYASDATLNIAMLYTLGVFIVSRYTGGCLYGIFLTVAAVLSVNFFFTYPYGDFNFTLQGYQITFVGMLIIGIVTSFTSTLMKEQTNLVVEQEKRIANQEKELLEAEKERMRANLLRAVSHDLRTPLTGIIGNADSYIEMNDSLSESEKKEMVESIGNDANWLLNMVENILTVTRINPDNAGVKTELEAVDEVVSATVVQFRKRFPDADLKVSLPSEVLMCQMDAMLIQQVILNILQNAVMHSESAEPIELYITYDEKSIYFHVKDYGIGIPENKLESIFDGEGLRNESARADGYKGMGIGLSICKTIVSAHGGKIYCQNHEGGAEFVFLLPREE